ncbi:histidine kinase [Chitinophaga barathri]|uniref:Histidine kinase n=2 Tax=Chitinophaga barathri TaxID=1647451 RepID=A0A3N4M867_9BACT|nr:histidine kinase [Chitinophaga barathri]
MLCAQQPNLYFEKLTTQNGLSHNKVNCFVQDRRGFMWIGTEDGLNRYDGHSFVVFRHEPGNPSSVSGNIITSLLEDEAEVLWIATADGGLTRYDYRLPPERQFKQYRHSRNDSASIPVNTVNTLLHDAQGYVWLGTGGKGVWRFNKTTEKFEQPVTKGTQGILDLCMDRNGIIWVGRQGGGLLKINSRNLSFEADARYADLYARLPHTTVTALYADGRDNMWYGSWDKVLYRYNARTNHEEVFREGAAGGFVNDEIISFAEDRNGWLWIGGRQKGLQLYNEKQNRFYHYRYNASLEGTVADDRINSIYTDKQGTVWLATNKGISISPVQAQFEQVFLPPGPADKKSLTVYDFFREHNQELWIGTDNGIYTWQDSTASFRHIPLQYQGRPLSVTKFFRDTDGAFYLGTDYSLFRFDTQHRRLSLLPNTGKDSVMNRIIESRVVSIARDTIDQHPVLLVLPYGHFLAYYDLVEQRWVSRVDTAKKILQRFNLKDNLLRKIFKARNGNIWLATAKSGLGSWEKQPSPRVRYLDGDPSEPGSIHNNHVYDITEDAKGNLWVSTYGGGLHYFDVRTEKFKHIAGSNNLLEGIQADEAGNIWMIGSGDLYKYDPVKDAWFSFRLPDLKKTGGITGNIYKDPAGKMYVTGAGYFIAFDPAAVRDMHRTPDIFFTDLKVFNTSFSHLLRQDKITLQHDQNYFRIEFAAPDFSPAGNVRYSYRLEGWDKNWVDNGSQNFAQFSNLAGGEYIFQVKATGGPGAREGKTAYVRIIIIPPFWRQWWFYAAVAILLSGAVYGIYRYRVNELLKRQAIRNKIAQDLHDNVGSTLSSIAVFSEVAQIHHQRKNEDELSAAITRISDTAGEMISEMNDIVWAINPGNDSMSTILQRMESFARPLLAARNIRFHLEAGQDVMQLNLEMTRRKNLYLIFKESVNNALKYADCVNLWVSIRLHQHELEMTVRDDGKGFDQATARTSPSLSGNGLRNMEMRAAEMKGTLITRSQPGEGTVIQLKFPVS